jgi:hypothetical protein
MGQAPAFRIPLRVVFYREGKRWVAHCLEFDLIGDGDNQGAALRCLSQAIGLQIDAAMAHRNVANLFSPAEGKVFAMFARGTHTAEGVVELRRTSAMIEAVEVREYADGDAALALC